MNGLLQIALYFAYKFTYNWPINKINWANKAFRQLNKIADHKKRDLIYDKVDRLKGWPACSANIARLQGRKNYRLRIGNYRVIFEIDQLGNPIIINITQVEKRNERTY